MSRKNDQDFSNSRKKEKIRNQNRAERLLFNGRHGTQHSNVILATCLTCVNLKKPQNNKQENGNLNMSR